MPEPGPRQPLRGRRVLMVEGDDVTADDLWAELERLGAEVLGPGARPCGGHGAACSDAPA